MTLNGHFALNSVLRRCVWSSEAWLSKLGYTLKLVVKVVGELEAKKNSCGIARFPCDSTAFLLQLDVQFGPRTELTKDRSDQGPNWM